MAWRERLEEQWTLWLTRRDQVIMAAVVVCGFAFMGTVGHSCANKNEPVVIEGAVDNRATPPRNAAGDRMVVPPSQVIVHVAGAVLKPGVVRLPVDARVEDAIAAAGGATKGANLDELNLAAKLEDGTQLFIPRVEAATSAKATLQPKSVTTRVNPPYRAPKAVVPSYASKPTPLTEQTPERSDDGGIISINTASASQLESLPGIGPAIAKRIVDFRKEKGPFRSIEGLLDVKGIGPKKFAELREHVRL